MVGFLIIIFVFILFGIFMIFLYDAEKNNSRFQWGYVLLLSIPVSLVFGFLIIVALHGRTGF